VLPDQCSTRAFQGREFKRLIEIETAGFQSGDLVTLSTATAHASERLVCLQIVGWA
jgi:hypothetical protein